MDVAVTTAPLSKSWKRRKKSSNNNFIFIIIACLVVLVGNRRVDALKNEFLSITELCQNSGKSFLSNIPRPIDGVVVTSRNERDLQCVITFQTESILERFMLRFEHLRIDCNDKLTIYDGSHAIGTPKANLSCDKTAASFGQGGVIFTLTNFVTLRYITDSWGTDDNGFQLVITAFKDAELSACRDGFQCDTLGICIDNDLSCDNVNHCAYGEDERSSHFCSLKRSGALFSAIMSVGRICPCVEDQLAAASADDDDDHDDDGRERGKHFDRARHSAVGFPNFFGNGNDQAAQMAILVAIFLVISGAAIACWIVSCRKSSQQQAQNGGAGGAGPGASTYQMRSLKPTKAIVELDMPQSTQSYSTSLMATGNTHHIFGSAPPIQDDPFAQSSDALISLLDNSGNASHPVAGRGSRTAATAAKCFINKHQEHAWRNDVNAI